MSALMTIARPYAKAAFDFSIINNNVEHWRLMLTFCAEISQNKQISQLISSNLPQEKLIKIFILLCDEKLDIFCLNLIRIMAENRRLAALPAVLKQFINFCKIKEAIAIVDVISINRLKEKQLEKISAAMEQRLSCKVQLNCKIDKSIIAGIVIRVGDTVIDGSIRDRLDRLLDNLQS